MEAVFLKILNMSITAGWIALAVIMLRLLLKKAPKAISVVLWSLVGIRLICPFSFESALSLMPSAEVIPNDILYTDTPTIHSGISALNSAVNPIISNSLAPNAGASVNPMQAITFAALVIWIVGIAAILLYAVISYIRVQRKVSEAALLEDNIWVCDHIDTPFILGIIRPRIYLPSDMSGRDVEYVVAHEKAHLQRRDYWWKPLGFVLLSVYWFNPVLWIAYILLCRDIELACDEKVIKEMGDGSKKPYSDALINCSVPRKVIAACPLAFGEVGVKGRIKSVLNYKKPAFWVIIAAVAVCVLAAVGFLTNPITNDSVDERLFAFIDVQIYDHHVSPHSADNYRCMDFKVLGTDTDGDETTVYMWVLYREYSNDKGLKVESGAHTPTVITARRVNDYYELVEYWEPRDGSYYAGDIKDKFPIYLWSRALDSQKYIGEQSAALEQMAKKHFGISTPSAGKAESTATADMGMVYYYSCITEKNTSFLSLAPEDKSFSFCLSLLASYFPDGTYEEDGRYIVLNTSGGNNKYTFRKDGQNLVFVAAKSSAVPEYRYAEGSKAEPCIADGTVFEFCDSLKTDIGRISADIDGDGKTEDCFLGYGPTSGVFTFTFSAYENDKLEYFNMFISSYLDLDFEKCADGKVRVRGEAQGEDNAVHYYDISIKNGNIVLSEGREAIGYWGEQGINSPYSPE